MTVTSTRQTSRKRGRWLKRSGLASLVALTASLTGGVALADGHLAPSDTDVQPVLSFADESDTAGLSVLTRTDTMLLATVQAEGLTAGDAYTLWWVVFNNPAGCSDGECGADDIEDPDSPDGLNHDGIAAAQIGLGNATGNVGRNGGIAEFGARLAQNDDSGRNQVVIPAGFGESPVLLTVSPHDAEVHVVIQSHGQALGGNQLSQQLSEFQAGCTPTCEDIQFAVHQPNSSPETPEGSATGTVNVNVAIRSVTVSQDEFTFDTVCRDADGEDTGDGLLGFPNGQCSFRGLTVTNGDAPAHIHVRGTDFEGSEGGTPWNLVDFDPTSRPGVDEALLWVTDGGVGTVYLSNDDQCDDWDPDADVPERCAAEPGQSQIRNVAVRGPESTTDPSPSFSTTITWSALP